MKQKLHIAREQFDILKRQIRKPIRISLADHGKHQTHFKHFYGSVREVCPGLHVKRTICQARAKASQAKMKIERFRKGHLAQTGSCTNFFPGMFE